MTTLETSVLGRYEYTLIEHMGQYFVRCRDTALPHNTRTHGPWSQDEARAMIDARRAREEERAREC